MIPFDKQLILFCDHMRVEKTELYEKVRDLGMLSDGRIYSVREFGKDYNQEDWDNVIKEWVKFSEEL